MKSKKILKAKNHRPFIPKSDSYIEIIDKNIKKLEEIKENNPDVNIESLKNILLSKI